MPKTPQATDKFRVGESVMAKWPGNNKALMYPGKVIDKNDIEYLVEFEDEDKSQLIIQPKNVMAPFIKRRSSSRGRSPGRKSPSRKSPGRPSSRGRAPSVVKENNSAPAQLNSSDENVTRLRGRPKKSHEVTPIRQSARLAEKVTVLETKTNNVQTFVSRASIDKTIKTQTDPGFLYNTASKLVSFIKCLIPTVKALPAIVFIIFGAFLFHQLCSKKKCTVTHLPVFPKELRHYFDVKAVLILSGFLLVQLLLFLLPIGKVVKPSNGASIRINSYIVLLINLLAIPAFLHFKIDVLIVYQLFRQLLVSSVVLGIVLSLIFFIKSKYVEKSSLNPRGNTGHFIPDLLEGREVSPTIKSLDVKYFLFRVLINASIVMNMIVIMKDIQNRKGNYSPTVLVAASLQILYSLDLVWFEETYLTTFEYNNQGAGLFVFVGYLSGVFYSFFISRFVMNHRSELEWYYLTAIVVLNLVGYVIRRSSDSQKHAFRTNPASPALSHLETIPTATGTRLLVSGWWGFVRHPNYLGDMIVQISWGILCGFTHALPLLLIGFSLLYLLSRIFIVEAACKAKYRLAWDNYTSRIKYRLIPRIF